jgi:hypothetical protein
MKTQKRLDYEKAYRKRRYEETGRSEYFTTKAERKEFKKNAIELLKNYYNNLTTKNN